MRARIRRKSRTPFGRDVARDDSAESPGPSGTPPRLSSRRRVVSSFSSQLSARASRSSPCGSSGTGSISRSVRGCGRCSGSSESRGRRSCISSRGLPAMASRVQSGSLSASGSRSTWRRMGPSPPEADTRPAESRILVGHPGGFGENGCAAGPRCSPRGRVLSRANSTLLALPASLPRNDHRTPATSEFRQTLLALAWIKCDERPAANHPRSG